MGDRIQTCRRARIAGVENQIAFLGSSRRPFEVTRRTNRLIFFVNAHQRHVDVEARKVEVVRIAAKKCGLEFRHENQTHVGVFFIAIEIVLSALIERDDVATKPGGFRRLGFDRRNLGAPSGKRRRIRHSRFDCSIDARGHVFDAHQHVEFQAGRFDLFRRRARNKSLFRQILLRRAHVVNDVFDDMIVRQYQPIRRNERAGSAVVESHGSELHLPQPFVSDIEAVLLFDLGPGNVIERPHAFIGKGGEVKSL